VAQESECTLGEGLIPLVNCANIGRDLGLDQVYVKDETRNPTGSFKDRMIALTVSQARQSDHETILTVSDGNLGSKRPRPWRCSRKPPESRNLRNCNGSGGGAQDQAVYPGQDDFAGQDGVPFPVR